MGVLKGYATRNVVRLWFSSARMHNDVVIL